MGDQKEIARAYQYAAGLGFGPGVTFPPLGGCGSVGRGCGHHLRAVWGGWVMVVTWFPRRLLHERCAARISP